MKGPLKESGVRMNLQDAVRKVLEVELAANPKLLIFGEDVGAKGGVHGATVDLQVKFGEARVFDTSLSEEGIIRALRWYGDGRPEAGSRNSVP